MGRFRSRLAAAVAAASALCAPVLCSPALAADPFRIGFIGGLTGYLTELDTGARDGLQIGVDEINKAGGILGRQLEIIIEDNRSEPSAAVTALNKLLTGSKVDFILGGLSSASTRAMSPILVRRKMPAIVGSILPGEEDKEGRRWIFTTVIPVSYDVEARYAHFKKNNLTQIAIIHDTTPYAKLVAERGITAAEPMGLKVVGVEQYSPGVTDLSPQLTKLKALAPQAIVQMGAGPAIGLAAKNLRDIGLAVVHASDQNTNPHEVVRVAGAAGSGVLFPAAAAVAYDVLADNDPRKIAAKSFIETWRAKYGNERDPNTGARFYDSVRLLAHGVRAANSTDGTAVRDALEATRDFNGVTATFNFSAEDHNGITSSPVVLVKIEQGGALSLVP